MTPRITLHVQLVLRAMLQDPDREMYGLQLCAATGLASATVYPLLIRLARIGWLDARWEEGWEGAAHGRPQRHYYRLTPAGVEQARRALATARTPIGRLIP